METPMTPPMTLNPQKSSELIAEHKQALQNQAPLSQAFAELSDSLAKEVHALQRQQQQGNPVVPELSFAELQANRIPAATAELVRQRGCVVIRQVFPQAQVEAWNEEIVRYIEDNDYYEREKEKRGLDRYFSDLAAGRPQIFGLYWSRPQMQARQSEELAVTRRWLNRLWDFEQEGATVFDPDRECTYADRLRRRQPGDSTLGLSPHVDGGSVERWLDPGFRHVYRHVFSGNWQQYQPFAAAYRTQTREIPSPAVCQMFRTYQGWTALTEQGPGDGTLKLIPIARGMAWVLLRALQEDVPASSLCDAQPGRALSIVPEYHQLLLDALVSIPTVQPGDTVWWHPDVVHAVEDQHQGQGYSNVMYIGAAPDCAKNREFLPKQAQAFLAGQSNPDFAPENYEVDFVGRALEPDLTPLGRRQLGLERW